MNSGNRKTIGAWSTVKTLAESTPETRNRYIDFLRAVSIIVVVIGHWLLAAPVIDRSEFTLNDMLQTAPWMQWLTWAFQVMPIFFIVGGYANAASWESAQRGGRSYGIWAGARLRRLIGPIIPLILLWAGIAVVGNFFAVNPDMLRIGSQLALLPTWFLAMYVMVVVAVPATHALWRRWKIYSVGVLALGAALIDAVAFSNNFHLIRWFNYAFVWLGVHQLGYAWHAGRVSGPARGFAWAVVGLTMLLFLVTAAGYPVSMLTVPGEEVSNSRPPTLALFALGMFHWGILLALEAPARRWLRNIWPWLVTILINRTIMTLYLWHVTAMMLIIGIAGIAGGVGLDIQPGSWLWWITRPLWFLICAAALTAFIVLFGRLEQSARSGSRTALPAWQALAGAASVCFGLAALSLGGISAPGATGIRIWIVIVTLTGAGLVLWAPLHRLR